MGAAWTVADGTLYAMLSAWLGSLNPASWYVLDLYTNDHTPQPGDESGDYFIPTTAQWPGYVGVQLLAESWVEPSVSNHVAQTHQPDPAEFSFPQGSPSLTVYGYVVTDGYGNLRWAEEFDEPIALTYPAQVTIQPYFNLGILPSDSETFARAIVGRADDDDDDGGED
jgi:hypothetical protein